LRLDRVERASPDIPLDPPQVLPDEREYEPLDGMDSENEPAEIKHPWEISAHDPDHGRPDAGGQGESAARRPQEDAGPLDRLRPEAGEHVQGEACKAERRVSGAALARPVLEVDLHDARAGREDERLRELLLSDHTEHRSESVARVGVEGATEVRDVGGREAAQHSVDEARRK